MFEESYDHILNLIDKLEENDANKQIVEIRPCLFHASDTSISPARLTDKSGLTHDYWG